METTLTQHLSQRITQMTESATIKMAQLGRELKNKGIDIIDLSLGEPDFTTPKHIGEAAKKAIDDGYTHYTPVAGYAELRKAISEKFMRDNGLDYSTDEIVVSTGAKQSLANVILCLAGPGDEVIIPAPYWVSYAALVQLAEATSVFVHAPIERDFKITAQELEAAITDRTKIFLFCSPCNPTGSVYTKEELEGFAKVIARHPHLFVVADEIYEYINFDGKHESIAQFSEIKDRVITVNGFSKGFAMTGWRLGYIGAPKWIAKACDKMQGQFTSGTCSIAQKAAEAALTSDLTATYEMRDAFHRRRDLIVSLLKDVPGLKINNPQGAFYVFPDVSSFFGKSNGEKVISNADDFAMYMLSRANVSLVSGSAFGDDNCVRISYATSEEKIRKAVEKIKEAVGELK